MNCQACGLELDPDGSFRYGFLGTERVYWHLVCPTAWHPDTPGQAAEKGSAA